MQNDFIENLSAFGLTRLEASIYSELLTHGELSGYEVVKETGISRSNVYSSLSALVDKGAAYLIEGETNKYTPVDVETFVANTMNLMQKKGQQIIANAPEKLGTSTGYISIIGSRHIEDKIRQMILGVANRLYIMADSEILETFLPELTAIAEDGKKIVILSDKEVMPLLSDKNKESSFHKTQCEKGQIRMIADSNYVLTGELFGGQHDTCLYSGQENLVKVMKEALKDKIILLGN